jgi:F-type H+-transporting ATPase subunit beta
MQKYESLKNIIAIVGENELSPVDRVDYQNAKKLIDFFSQDFHVTEHLSGKPGQFFTREQTLSGIESILNSTVPAAKPAPASATPAPAAPAETEPPKLPPEQPKQPEAQTQDKPMTTTATASPAAPQVPQ